MCRDMARSALKTASGEVEILVGVENAELADYIGAIDDDRVRIFGFGDGYGVGRIWNLLAESAKGDLLLMGNDDQTYSTRGWDEGFEVAAANVPDGIFVAWCDDGINGGRHAAFPCVSRRWYETLGYFVPEVFSFFFHDTWLFDLGHRIGRLRYLPDVLVKHLHWTHGGVDDETTRRNRNTGQSVKDRHAWIKTEQTRAEHAAILKELIAESSRLSSGGSSPERDLSRST